MAKRTRKIEIDPQTNVGRVINLMESGSPLMQAFVIEAIAKYAAACAKEPASTFDSGLLHGQAWLDCAKHAKAWNDALYGSAS